MTEPPAPLCAPGWHFLKADEIAWQYEAEWSHDGGVTWTPVGDVKRITVTQASLDRGLLYRRHDWARPKS